MHQLLPLLLAAVSCVLASTNLNKKVTKKAMEGCKLVWEEEENCVTESNVDICMMKETQHCEEVTDVLFYQGLSGAHIIGRSFYNRHFQNPGVAKIKPTPLVEIMMHKWAGALDNPIKVRKLPYFGVNYNFLVTRKSTAFSCVFLYRYKNEIRKF